jgi:hypothetical protein
VTTLRRQHNFPEIVLTVLAGMPYPDSSQPKGAPTMFDANDTLQALTEEEMDILSQEVEFITERSGISMTDRSVIGAAIAAESLNNFAQALLSDIREAIMAMDENAEPVQAHAIDALISVAADMIESANMTRLRAVETIRFGDAFEGIG